MQRKNAEVIKAWADGKVIQFQPSGVPNSWKDFRGENDYEPHIGPWSEESSCFWRIKPKEPEVVVKYINVGYAESQHHVEGMFSFGQPKIKSFISSGGNYYDIVAQLRLTTDAETGKVLSVELVES